MQNAPREHSAILSTFIKLPVVLNAFALSIFQWPLKTGFTVYGRSITIFYLSLTACSGDKFTIAVRSVSLYDHVEDIFHGHGQDNIHIIEIISISALSKGVHRGSELYL